jgi:UDP-N-acetylmuramate dehydrogenase
MQLIPKPDFRERTTLRLGGQGLLELLVQSAEDWEELTRRLKKEGGRPLALGAGSNLLAAEGELNWIIVRLAPEKNIEILGEAGEDSYLLQVNAGMSLPGLLAWLGRHDLSGLQGLTGIPGTVGGAVAMNAGSFGQDMSQVLQRVCIWTQAEGLRWLGPEQWKADYRSFVPQVEGSWFLINAVQIQVSKASGVKKEMRKVFNSKKRAQPISSWTCGCLFKNSSAKEPAGLLLERCGLRGFTLGGMKLSEVHANFLINTGSGQSSEAFELIDLARSRVREKFGHQLELEVKTVA